MEINFDVAKYDIQEGKFVKTGYKPFKIQFKLHNAPGHWKICVNGLLTKHLINIMSTTVPHKEQILKAISDYENDRIRNKVICTKFISEQNVKAIFSPKIKHVIFNHILTISKEDKRDTLTKYELIIK